jgi:hypothetical protein
LESAKLATALGITRQPGYKFFAGESISRSCFVQICQQLGLSWQFYVNKLLIDCLNSAAYVTPRVRQEIEDTLLLAIADIENVRKSYTNIVSLNHL